MNVAILAWIDGRAAWWGEAPEKQAPTSIPLGVGEW